MEKKAQIIIKSCNRRDIELDRVQRFLAANGYAVSVVEARQFEPLDESRLDRNADLILLSTCAFSSVTEEASLQDSQLVQLNKKPSAQMVVCGCLPEINPERLREVFDGKTFGPRSYETLDEIIPGAHQLAEFPDHNLALSYGSDTCAIQIQEGCPCRCSYCAIKLSIGELKSKPVDTIIGELRAGLAAGYRKVAFLGDCSGGYGIDNRESLGTLLQRVLEIDGELTLTLTDIAPFHLQSCIDEIRQLARRGSLSQLYVATQSANPRILGLMRRKCDMELVKGMLLELKQHTPSLVLITSIIVGFPSETWQEMEDTVRFCEEIGFSNVYCHGYSARPGVESVQLPGQHSQEEIKRRCEYVKEQLGAAVTLTTIPGEGARLY